MKENAGVVIQSSSSTHKTSSDEKAVYVSTLVGDKKIVKQIIKLAKNGEEDPPIIFAWNDDGVQEFVNKAVGYGATGGLIMPPNQSNGGAHLVGQAAGAALRAFKTELLEFVRAQVIPAPAVVGDTACLACTNLQFGQVTMHLGLMVHHPWLNAVLGHGAPLTYPLASLWLPRPNVTTGVCDQILCPTMLWA
jgi:hypothetical protein